MPGYLAKIVMSGCKNGSLATDNHREAESRRDTSAVVRSLRTNKKPALEGAGFYFINELD